MGQYAFLPPFDLHKCASLPCVFRRFSVDTERTSHSDMENRFAAKVHAVLPGIPRHERRRILDMAM
jgi:hypothetical protein